LTTAGGRDVPSELTPAASVTLPPDSQARRKGSGDAFYYPPEAPYASDPETADRSVPRPPSPRLRATCPSRRTSRRLAPTLRTDALPTRAGPQRARGRPTRPGGRRPGPGDGWAHRFRPPGCSRRAQHRAFIARPRPFGRVQLRPPDPFDVLFCTGPDRSEHLCPDFGSRGSRVGSHRLRPEVPKDLEGRAHDREVTLGR
jgi:hypothetical protein